MMVKEHGFISPRNWLTLLSACLFLCSACAGREMPPALYSNPIPAFEGTYSLMQRVRLTIPHLDFNQTFNAAVTVTMPDKKARVVALSGMGLTFFDVIISGPNASDEIVQYIHPTFKRFPVVKDHILWSTRLVLLHALALKPTAQENQVNELSRQFAENEAVVYTLTPEGRLLSAKQTGAGKPLWTLICNDYEGIWPRVIHLDTIGKGYSVQVTTYSIQREP